MIASVSLCFLIAYLLLYRFMFASTFVGFSIRDRQLSGLLFLFYDCIFVLPALILIPLIGPEAIRTLSHHVTPASLPAAVFWVWYALFAFGLTFWLIRAALGHSISYDGNRMLQEQHMRQNRFRLMTFNRMLGLGIVLLLSYSLLIQGAKHALFHGLIHDVAPGVLRHQNANISGLSYVKHYINVSCILMSILLACPAYRQRRLERLFLLIIVFTGSTFYGSKSPLIIYLLAFVFAAIEFQPQLSFRLVLRRLSIAMAALSVILTVLVVLIGASGFELWIFLDYFWNRVFIGQMAGWFEQWNLLLWEPGYVLHSIPFASLLNDYPVFHKDLMLISEGRIDGSQIGIKVTFYLAEAYAMLGWIGLVISPFIMAIQFIITFLVLSFVLQKLVFGTPATARFTASYFFVSFFSTTDGLSEMLAYKGLTILLIIIAPACLSTWFIAQMTAARHRPRLDHSQEGTALNSAQLPKA